MSEKKQPRRNDTYQNYSSNAKKPRPAQNSSRVVDRSARETQSRMRSASEDARPAQSRARSVYSDDRDTYSRKRRKKQRVSSFLIFWHWVRAILIALILSMILRTFCFDIVLSSSSSMNDVLRAGDIVLMTKFDYWVQAPARGDIVGFTANGATALSLKRVVGLPGETIEIINGETFIDNNFFPEEYIFERDSLSYTPIFLPTGHFMLLGDNRPVSADSRDEEIGLVARGQINGKVRMVLWPISRFGVIE